MTYEPFYLQGSGPNLLTDDLVSSFFECNPDLCHLQGIYTLELRILDLSYFESFCAWILSQQISGYVAETLINRLRQILSPFEPSVLLNTDVGIMKDIGLSRTKIKYIYNVADFFEKDKYLTDHDKYSSKEIMDHYSMIKGVGPWTVNMFSIFNLGRLDISAPKDLVVRKGMKRLYKLDDVPTEVEAKKLMQSWGDLGTIGTILSWAVMGE